MASEAAAALDLIGTIGKTAADIWATVTKIGEGIADYTSEIANMEANLLLRETIADNQYARAKQVGIAQLEETSQGAAFDTRMATMKAAQTAGTATAKIAASGVRSTGTALMGAQQASDIAYAGAARTEEAGASAMKVGGLQLGNQLKSQVEAKSLLTQEFGQNITEQKRKKAELEKNAAGMIAAAAFGGLGTLAGSFYRAGDVWKKKD